MVIYNCDHYGAFTQLLALKYSKHPDETSVLICGNNGERTEVLEKLRENKVFDYIVSFPGGIARMMTNQEEIIQRIQQYVNDEFNKIGIDVKRASEIYTSTDLEGTFAFYLNFNGIQYSALETSPGQLFDEHRYEIYLEMGTGSKEYVELQKKYRLLTHDCNLIKKCILYPETQTQVPDNIDTEVEFFDFNDQLTKLPESARERLLRCFNINIELFREPHCLLLPNSGGFTWQCGLPVEKYPLVYQLLVDYYKKSEKDVPLLIKQHPYGFMNFKDNFKDAIIIDRSFPIELINLYPEILISEAISVHTTAASKVADRILTQTSAGNYFFKALHYIHKLCVVFSIAKHLINDATNFHQYVENPEFLQNFVEQLFPELKRNFLGINPNILKGNIFTVIDSCPATQQYNICGGLQDASVNAITVFINTKNDFCFYDTAYPEVLENMIPIKIQKKKLRENIIENLEEEYIYIFSKDENIKRKIRSFTMKKRLEYTGVELSVNPVEDVENENIKLNIRLKGMEKAISNLLKWQNDIRRL